MDWVFVHVRRSNPVAVDVFPRLGAIEGQLVGANSDNGAIFIVKTLVGHRQSTT